MKSRSYGVDLLKSVSMLMIVILHILGVGGILSATAEGTFVSRSAWFLEAMNICAVNCFGLISGYVLCRGHYRRSRLLSLWLRVVFEMLVITAVFAAVLPDAVGRLHWLAAVTPVTHGVYWYFTAYFGLFFFVPYINKMIAALSRKELISLALSVVLVFTVIGNLTHNDTFYLQGGYCFLWLLCLYVLGACVRYIDIPDRFNKFWYLAGYFVCVVCAWGAMLVLKSQKPISYTSPMILCAAFCLLLFFRKLEIRGSFSRRAVNLLSRTSFGVYIIHTQPLIWANLLSGRFISYLNYPVPVTLALVILTALAIYAVCTLGDWLAEKFFKLIRIQRLEAAFDGIGRKNSRKSQNALLK